MPGFLASTFLIPSTQTAIVVLANALPFMDPTNLVGQLILSVLIGEKPATDFVPLAKLARANGLGAYAVLTAAVKKRKTGKPPRLPLMAYEGRYRNAAENFRLTITACGAIEGAGLLMKVQDAPQTNYRVKPYDGDTFYWPPDREKELCEKGMWLNLLATSHEIIFGASEDGQSISRLIWHHDPAAKPEMFRKREPLLQGTQSRL